MSIFRIIFVNGTDNLNYLQQKMLSLSIHTPDKHTVLKNTISFYWTLSHLSTCQIKNDIGIHNL